LRFVPLPPPTTTDVEELTRTVAGRLTERLAAAAEEQGDYLDPDQTLVEPKAAHSGETATIFPRRTGDSPL
jgi:hypothetical protein